jgi:hypothetical protein
MVPDERIFFLVITDYDGRGAIERSFSSVFTVMCLETPETDGFRPVKVIEYFKGFKDLFQRVVFTEPSVLFKNAHFNRSLRLMPRALGTQNGLPRSISRDDENRGS